MKKSKDGLLYLIAFILVLIIVVCTALAIPPILNFFEKNEYSEESYIEDTILNFNGVDYILRDENHIDVSVSQDGTYIKKPIETLLILGLDKFYYDINNEGYNNDQQADFLLLLVFDNENKKCSAIQINRDTITDVNVLGVAGERIDSVKKQIALAHTHGNGKEISCRNTADAVSNLLYDIRIDHYASLTMDAVSIVNDAVGGVEVTVLDDFSDIDDSLKKGQQMTLRGEQALTYVRTRYGLEDSSNNNRMKRQHQYLKALYEKINSGFQSNDEFLANTSLKIADHLVSDCSVNSLEELFRKFSSYEFTEIYSFEGITKKGENFMEFYPDENSVKKIVIDLFYKPKE